MLINNTLRRTKLFKPTKYYEALRTMWKKAIEIGSKTTLTKTATEVMSTVPKRAESFFVLTDQESEGDTSKTNHPTGIEISCNASNCKEKNCAKDVSNCDPETQEATKAFHITHSTKGVETDKVTTELRNSEGGKVYAVIHEEKEDVENPYNQYRHKDTVMAQEDSNTKALQKVIEKQPEKNNYEQNK